MLENIKNWILNITTIIIIISFMEILIPDGKMKKYINLVFGFIVMVVILTPIINILNSKEDLENDVFMISSELNKKEYSFINSNIENRQGEQLASLYKDRIKKDIIYRIESKYDVRVAEVNIEMKNGTQKEIGDIKRLTISIADEEGSKEDTIPIVKIDVTNDNSDKINRENTNNNVSSDINIGLRKRIRDDISNIYNLYENSVVVLDGN